MIPALMTFTRPLWNFLHKKDHPFGWLVQQKIPILLRSYINISAESLSIPPLFTKRNIFTITSIDDKIIKTFTFRRFFL